MMTLPTRVNVVDVSARDGLQSFPRWVDTDVKVAMIDRLSETGFPVIEVTGMAHPRVIPNLQDAEIVLERIQRRPGTCYRALVPNARGAERAARASVPPDEVIGLIVASETYLKKNQGMTSDEAVAQAIQAFEIAERAGMRFVMSIAGSFWDIYEGRTPMEKVIGLVDRFQASGMRSVCLAGSLGMEDPVHVGRLFGEVGSRWPQLELGYHVHNLGGLATANILAALDAGARFLEGSICGVGGGIAMPGAIGPVGNLASEDIVYLLAEMGIETGISVDEVVRAARDIARLLDIEPVGHIARCGSRQELLKGARQ